MAYSPRKLIWKLFEFLPNKIKHNIIRNTVNIDTSQLSGIEIRVARDQKEIHQAFKLLYEAYLENGLMDPKSHELRITKYHCLPTSAIIVALHNGEVIGTITHVLDSQLGLPSDSAIDFSSFRKRGKRIAEVSAFAVKKSFRRSHALIFAMTRYMFYYATKYTGVDYWVIGVRSNVASYYQALFFYNKFKTKKISHGFVKGSPSYFLYANLKEFEGKFLKHYSGKPADKDLYKFYFQMKMSEVGDFSQFKFNLPLNYCYDKDAFESYFREKEKIIDSLNEVEKLEVLNAYKEIYPDFFHSGDVGLSNVKSQRKGVRYISFYEIEILRSINKNDESSLNFNKEFITSGHILNFSRTGFLLKTNQKIDKDEVYLVRFVNKYPVDKLISFKVVNDQKNNLFSGFILKNSIVWQQFIDQIEYYYYSQANANEESAVKSVA